MNRLLKRCLAGVTAAFIVVGTAASADAQALSSSLPLGSSQGVTDPPSNLEPPLGGEASTPNYPIFPEDAIVPSGEVIDFQLDPEETLDWKPTEKPNPNITLGQMRSDREEIPGGFTKAEADLAEIREAQLEDESSPTLNALSGCKVYWPSPYQVCGLIRELYDSIGGPQSFLTFPKSNELTNPDGVGKRTEFINGFIYWHPNTGAHTVSIPATVVWAKYGWESGHFGYPLTSDVSLGDQWFRQSYQGGYIYTRNSVPAVQAGIQGAIYDKWAAMGAQNSVLGFPIGNEETTPDGAGKYNLFERGIMIWHPLYGAYAITGDILLQWVYSGGYTGQVGYPTSDPVEDTDGWKKQDFVDGPIYGKRLESIFPTWNPVAGTEDDSPALQSNAVGVAGGNAYTDAEIIPRFQDGCGESLILRRGWYNPEVKRGPWGYDKIVHKHGLWSLRTIETYLSMACKARTEGTDRVYEDVIDNRICDLLQICRPTGETFTLRSVYETEAFGGARENRGINTMYPPSGGTADKVPEWFNINDNKDER